MLYGTLTLPSTLVALPILFFSLTSFQVLEPEIHILPILEPPIRPSPRRGSSNSEASESLIVSGIPEI
jgi:hypothetical protein